MEYRGRFGSRHEDDDERRRDFERGWEGRRYRGEAYSGGYYGGGRRDWREPSDREGRERDWERESEGWSQRDRERNRGREDRNFMDRVTDEVRSWFGDEEAERRRRQDFREMYGREGREEGDRWDRPRWTGEYAPGRVDRTEFLGRDRDTETGRGERDTWRARETWGARDISGPRDSWNATEGSSAYGWAPRGPYTGRGPRGYRRSDDRIHEDICERFSRHGMLDASDVDVTVVSGDVTLRGSVPSRWAKREAEDLAESVSGVQDVHNELRVTQSGTGTREYQSGTSTHGYSPGGTQSGTGSGTSGTGSSPSGTTQPGSTQSGSSQPGFGRSGYEGEHRGRVA